MLEFDLEWLESFNLKFLTKNSKFVGKRKYSNFSSKLSKHFGLRIFRRLRGCSSVSGSQGQIVARRFAIQILQFKLWIETLNLSAKSGGA